MVLTRKKGLLFGALSAAFISCALLVGAGGVKAETKEDRDSMAEAEHSHFVLKGDFRDSFELTSNSEDIFHVETLGPGDSIHANIGATNVTEHPMELRIHSINNLGDDLLFKALNLTIEHDGSILFNGLYTDLASPVTKYITVPAGETILLDITVSFPEYLGNAYQGAEMENEWVFEALYAGDEAIDKDIPFDSDNNLSVEDEKENEQATGNDVIKTGAEEPEEKSNKAWNIFLAGLCFIAAGTLLIFTGKKK